MEGSEDKLQSLRLEDPATHPMHSKETAIYLLHPKRLIQLLSHSGGATPLIQSKENAMCFPIPVRRTQVIVSAGWPSLAATTAASER